MSEVLLDWFSLESPTFIKSMEILEYFTFYSKGKKVECFNFFFEESNATENQQL